MEVYDCKSDSDMLVFEFTSSITCMIIDIISGFTKIIFLGKKLQESKLSCEKVDNKYQGRGCCEEKLYCV